MFEDKHARDFGSIRVGLASAEDIQDWSYGEVTKAETINYRTLRPEVDGLMSERIFGPVKSYECFCGKYKGIRYKGIVCDKCGVEITHRRVRRHRMGHIDLAVPVVHVWFSYGVPNKLAIILDITQKDLTSVIYYSKYMVTGVDDGKKKVALKKIEEELEATKAKFKEDQKKEIEKAKADLEKQTKEFKGKRDEKSKFQKERFEAEYDKAVAKIKNVYFKKEKEEVDALREIQKIAEKVEATFVLSEDEYDQIVSKANKFFEAEMGAEAIRKVLANMDLDIVADELRELMKNKSKHKRMKAIKRLNLVDGFRNNGTKPEWLVLRLLPVISPDLRPIIQLPGGRFATSDLNDLYRRVINRNSRLKRLIEIGAPDIILRNEKRMLQEAVDALIDNEHRPSPAILNRRRQAYKSLAASLRGKKGRFRQNLLGKRVDYSGRSVIVGDSTLTLSECGLPREMALEMFKPFIMHEVIARDLSPNIRSAKTLIEERGAEIWDILEDLIKERPVMLNRAPTLHKQGIQAFYARLVDGDAIRVNPLICEGYNADFDGDQMAVHLPLTKEAVEEASSKMMAQNNILKLSDGKAIIAPKKDMILGLYFLTKMDSEQKKPVAIFESADKAISALELDQINIHDKILVRIGKELIETSVGRVIFNGALPDKMSFVNERVGSKAVSQIVTDMVDEMEEEELAVSLDTIKNLGFAYATYSGFSFGIEDCIEHPDKEKIIGETRAQEMQLEDDYMTGLITYEEKQDLSNQLWLRVTDELKDLTWQLYKEGNAVHDMIESGTNGSLDQLKQIASIKGLLVDPTGKYVEMPIISNFKNGMSGFEYFTNGRGARKGLADTALRTADSGYLTRKLVVVAEDLIIRREDCGQSEEGYFIRRDLERRIEFADTIRGRWTLGDVVDPKSGEVLAEKDTRITTELAKNIAKSELEGIEVRSPLTCNAVMGLCAKCYGDDLGTHRPVKIGKAVGVMAAQAMGELSTQLTLRTFHFGGAQKSDITQGVPRIEELFESRSPKGLAYVAEIPGKIKLVEDADGKKSIVIKGKRHDEQIFPVGKDDTPTMKRTKKVKSGDVLYVRADGTEFLAPFGGEARLIKEGIKLVVNEESIESYTLSDLDEVIVEDGQSVEAGSPLTKGAIDPKMLVKTNGLKRAQEYIIDEVQKTYASQGAAVDEKHVELIARQMGKYVQIIDPGDTQYTAGQFASKNYVDTMNDMLREKGLKPASFVQHLMGVTNASLRTDSFLSAVSFQEQVRVLTESAILGKVDYLRGLKENVIIGRLIPVGEEAAIEDVTKLGEFDYVRELRPAKE